MVWRYRRSVKPNHRYPLLRGPDSLPPDSLPPQRPRLPPSSEAQLLLMSLVSFALFCCRPSSLVHVNQLELPNPNRNPDCNTTRYDPNPNPKSEYEAPLFSVSTQTQTVRWHRVVCHCFLRECNARTKKARPPASTGLYSSWDCIIHSWCKFPMLAMRD